MRDDTPPSFAAVKSSDAALPRRGVLRALMLALLLPALAACKTVEPGSGLETIRRSRERSPPSGR